MVPAALYDFLFLNDDWRRIALRAHTHHLVYSPKAMGIRTGLTERLTFKTRHVFPFRPATQLIKASRQTLKAAPAT